MGYKTGGLKAKWRPQTSSYESSKEYTIYNALESVSDIEGFVIRDEDDKEVSIMPYWDEETAEGAESLIDVLYYLKHFGLGEYNFGSEWRNILIVEMTEEEMDKVFRHRK